MISRRTLLIGGIASLLVPRAALSQGLEDHCFRITPELSIAARKITTTPKDFLEQNPNVQAVINGVYFGSDDLPEGSVYLAEGHHLGTEKQGHSRGYFTVNKNGTRITAAEHLEGKLEDYWLTIGTHPLLLVDGNIHEQAREVRYSKSSAQRSAIGTKDGKNICFAVSRGDLTMSQWAHHLQEAGYQGAINLDGGPYSQLAVRKGEEIQTKGVGRSKTRLVIFAYKK